MDWPELVSHDPRLVSSWWTGRPYSVLLATGRAFDALEVSAFLGVSTAGATRRGPVARSSTGRWLLLVRPGSDLHPELAGRPDVVLHNAGSWIPAPPTPGPAGRMRWVVTPSAVKWRLPNPDSVQAMVAEALPVLRVESGGLTLRAA
jgi:hypothetical protein